MSALMAERRDWAEDPRQASLFDALAPPPERAQPDEPPAEGRIVEFPKRPGAPVAPEGDLAPAGDVAPTVEAAVTVEPAPAMDAAPTGDTAPAGHVASAGPAAPPNDAAPAAPAAQAAPAVLDRTPAAEGASAIEAEIVVTPDELAGEMCTPRAAGSPLAGPTLDDVMSRVWEGLATGLPAACPACHGEVLPALGGPRRGRCTSCGTTID